MRIVRVKGGLGNQLFQYSYAKLIEELTHEAVKLDYSACYSSKEEMCQARIKQFKLSLKEASENEIRKNCLFRHSSTFETPLYRIFLMLEKTFNSQYYFEPNRAYTNPQNIIDKQYYDGYWQSWRYVDSVKDKVYHDLVPLCPISLQSQEFINRVSREESVFLGIRKGDYTSSRKARKHFGSFSNSYFLSAMKIISERVPNPVFYIFSNDIQWCKQNIDWKDYSVCYRNPQDQVSDFEELLIMSSCKHAIIINSTFHWWGAYLIKNPDKIVVCPNQWFFDNKPIDIIPPYWTQLCSDGGLCE